MIDGEWYNYVNTNIFLYTTYTYIENGLERYISNSILIYSILTFYKENVFKYWLYNLIWKLKKFAATSR